MTLTKDPSLGDFIGITSWARWLIKTYSLSLSAGGDVLHGVGLGHGMRAKKRKNVASGNVLSFPPQ